MNSILSSVVRTFVPVVVGALLGWAAKVGLNLPNAQVTELVTVVFTTVYYAIVRFLETKYSSQFGWLLGLAKAPQYAASAGSDAGINTPTDLSSPVAQVPDDPTPPVAPVEYASPAGGAPTAPDAPIPGGPIDTSPAAPETPAL